ncbi:hypothetical protein [Nonomuraea sp. NPDC049504]|uniref:hypothetical protein n=1 Tax=Nonomuraea sp. NPDC049504 TaxID=3154729 RepID=UPI003424742D
MNSAEALTEATVLAAVNRWVGVIVALVGAIVAAPDGTRMIYRTTRGWAVKSFNKLTRRSQVIQVSGIGESAIASDDLTVTKTGWSWKEDAPVEEQIGSIRAYISDIEGRLNGMINALSTERQARQAAITGLAQELERTADQLTTLIDQKDQRAARVDARGLPLIGCGIFLNGVPEELAGIPLHLGWLLPFLAFGAMIVVLTTIMQSRATTS